MSGECSESTFGPPGVAEPIASLGVRILGGLAGANYGQFWVTDFVFFFWLAQLMARRGGPILGGLAGATYGQSWGILVCAAWLAQPSASVDFAKGRHTIIRARLRREIAAGSSPP